MHAFAPGHLGPCFEELVFQTGVFVQLNKDVVLLAGDFQEADVSVFEMRHVSRPVLCPEAQHLACLLPG